MTTVRPTEPTDAEAIRQIAASEPLFTAEDRACIDELLGDYLNRPDHNGYFFLTAESDGQVAGFACYGPTPLTLGTYDLYWICVDRRRARHGIGRQLMDQVERAIRERRGRLVVIETSGSARYAPTRAFYESLGWTRVAEVPHFYGPGDDRVIYTKAFRYR